LQAFIINTCSSYLVEMNLPALAVGTGPIKQTESAYISATAPAVIARRAEKKLIPTAFAEVFIGFADIFTAVDANRRPQKLIQTLQRKGDALF
jgi:hypothetical protein